MSRSGPVRFPSRQRLELPRTGDDFVAVPWEETLAVIERGRARAVRLEALTDSQREGIRADVAENCAREITAAYHEQQSGRCNYALTQDDVDALVHDARWRRFLADDSRWCDDPDNRAAVSFENDPHAPQDMKARLEKRPKPPTRARGQLPADAPRMSWSWTAWVSSFLAERRRAVGLDQVSLLPVGRGDDVEPEPPARREPGDDDEDAIGFGGEGAAPP